MHPPKFKNSTKVRAINLSRSFKYPQVTVRYCRWHDQSVYASFYSNEEIYSVATMPGCILIDVALAKGGPEAIAESFYATKRAQQQVGGQYNDTLVTRIKSSRTLPSVRLCDDILRESIKLYFKGDNHIKAHKSHKI